MKNQESEQSAIKTIIRNVNLAWSSGQVDELNHYFHDDLLNVVPVMIITGKR